MSLRVLDDDRPGFALLSFGAKLEQPSLSLSIRSLRENAFLGPEGKWQRAAHFFVAERAGETSRGTEYRVGPEIVNHLLEHDQIIVATEDGSLREQTLWENAIPQMPGSGGGHSIYRPPVKVVGTESAPAKTQSRPAPEPPPKPEPPAPVAAPPEPAPPPPQVVAKPEPAPPQRPQITPPAPSPTPPTNWLKYLALAAIPVVLIALFAVPQVRCGLFGMSCPAPVPTPTPTPIRTATPTPTASSPTPNPSEEALTRALSCASAVEASRKPCDVAGCFRTYLNITPPGSISARANDVMSRNADACDRAAAMPRGTYTGASLAGCGMPAEQGILLTVKGGTVSWQHQFKGVRYDWNGSVDAQGNISARAGTSVTARGRYSDLQREVQMMYPQCTEGITLTIIGRR
jgi:hypothetical protein